LNFKSVNPIWFGAKDYARECALFAGYIGPNVRDLALAAAAQLMQTAVDVLPRLVIRLILYVHLLEAP
jgi:hypothetical protein